MGSVFYDLASLLRDSYVTLGEPEAAHLGYAWRSAATKELLRAAGDPGAFEELLDAAALQRNVKAVGTFGNQAHNRGKKLYLRFIPPTVAHLRANFERKPGDAPAGRPAAPIAGGARRGRRSRKRNARRERAREGDDPRRGGSGRGCVR